jgi:SAM-dependent methyltransferase
MKKYLNPKKYKDYFSQKFKSIFWGLMKIDTIRFNICKLRWNYYKKQLKILDEFTDQVGEDTINHNISAFNHDAVFGMGKRMSLLLYPIAAFLGTCNNASLLIVGPRSEDDIFWAKSLGIGNTVGLDLFSYSNLIQLGDIHNTGLPSHSFDAILLGWMISYSSEPHTVINECKRLIKPSGYLGIGIESDPKQKYNGISPPRVNYLNTSEDLINLVNEEVVFVYDPKLDTSHECAVILKMNQLE